MICNHLRVDATNLASDSSKYMLSLLIGLVESPLSTVSPTIAYQPKEDPGRCKKEHMTLLISPAGIDWSIYSILLNKDID